MFASVVSLNWHLAVALFVVVLSVSIQNTHRIGLHMNEFVPLTLPLARSVYFSVRPSFVHTILNWNVSLLQLKPFVNYYFVVFSLFLHSFQKHTRCAHTIQSICFFVLDFMHSLGFFLIEFKTEKNEWDRERFRCMSFASITNNVMTVRPLILNHQRNFIDNGRVRCPLSHTHRAIVFLKWTIHHSLN